MVVIQQTQTRFFLGKAGGWVKAAADARDFRRAAEAVAYCAVERLAKVRVVIISDDLAQTVYFQPESSREELLKARNLRRRNRELRDKQRLLIAEMQTVQGQIAQQSVTLPMLRKKKRENPSPEELH